MTTEPPDAAPDAGLSEPQAAGSPPGESASAATNRPPNISSIAGEVPRVAPETGIEQPAAKQNPRSLANLRPGTGAMLASREKREAARQQLEQDVEAEMAEYPPDVRGKRSVRRLVLLSQMLERRAREAFEAGGKRELIDIASKLTSATSELIARLPRADFDRPTRRIPRNVMDWLDNLEEFEGPVEIVERDGSITRPKEENGLDKDQKGH